jgi:hypothetical protein
VKPPAIAQGKSNRVAVPRVLVTIANHEPTAPTSRAYRSFAGHYRWCYEQALAEDPGYQGRTNEPPLAGHWVARIAYGDADRICALDVIDTDLPEKMSQCLQRMIPRIEGATETAGQLELVLGFSPR